MVERIINGGFGSTVGTGDGADPANWVVSEPTANSVWVHDGVLSFNRGDSATGGSVTQTVGSVVGGRSVTFSFKYLREGSGATTASPSITYTVTRIAPDGSETVQLGPTLINVPGTYEETFTPPSGGPYQYRITFADSSTGTLRRDPALDSISFDAPLCFAKGTMIEAEHGQVPVEEIKVGDLILTADNGLQPVRWIGARHIPGAFLAARPEFRPIRIAAGALGANMPSSDLIVSPQHRVLLQSDLVHDLFDTNEVLVAAKHLLSLPGIDVIAPDGVDYFHLLFDWHEVVFANGAPAESLYLGEQALKTLSPDGRAEVMTLFPELRDMEDGEWPTSRPILKGREGRLFAQETNALAPALAA